MTYSPETYKVVLERKLVDITEKLGIGDGSLLLNRLLARGVITQLEKEEIESGGARFRKASKLMDILIRNSHHLPQFVLALFDDNQKFLAENITEYLPDAQRIVNDRKKQREAIKQQFGQ
ncbi:DgyrCDS7591 [Dimorphilus gyrociliatus]|uniref:DgyrCDS7591 n=1 Tax=Dimorphilus gyrociliatus TaxID=2664684 RepID=A0A7I8VT64_9ANNE|nr:DgyrCDS7591 [Dimorphilus gyrociliatus]